MGNERLSAIKKDKGELIVNSGGRGGDAPVNPLAQA